MKHRIIVVYRTIPTSNHNVHDFVNSESLVVYRTIPTSNHNHRVDQLVLVALYIVLFLHQTTTGTQIQNIHLSCISYYSYIKPQHSFAVPGSISRCISYYSYIKPQLSTRWVIHPRVVYRTIPTSNHNYAALLALPYYVVYRTIPTSTHNPSIRTVA